MSQTPTPNETGSRMFALEKAISRHPVDTKPEVVVAEAKLFFDFLSPSTPSPKVSSILQVRQ